MEQDKHIAELKRVIETSSTTETEIDPAAVAQIAERVGKAFHAASDEVAILTMNLSSRCLSFLYPEPLRTVGTIPLTSTSSLAARTARDKKPEAMNNFAVVRHASVFEGVPLGNREPGVIQKIMSAPITANGKTLGVVQVSRKGRNTTEAGPDFTIEDLKALVAMTGVLAEFLQRIANPP